MAVTTTTRVGLTKYGSDLDEWELDHFNDDADALEAGILLGKAGTLAARPAASAAVARMIYHATDVDLLYYCNGAAWRPLDGDRFTGEEVAYKGSSPAAGTRRIRQEGSPVVTVAGGGGAVEFAYPDPFPNGITSVVCVAGDNVGLVTPSGTTSSLSTWRGGAYNFTGGGTLEAVADGTAIRLMFNAVGW